ncbi:hypothetical protein Tco_0973320 [Tanacetum coccineum]
MKIRMNTHIKEDLDNLFGPMFKEYFKKTSSDTIINSAAQPTQVHKDSSSISSIFVDTHKAPSVVTTSDEQTSLISLTKVDEFNQEDSANFDGNAQFVLYNPPSREEIESSTTGLEPSNVQNFHQVFLNGTFDKKKSRVSQLEGFIDPEFPDHVRLDHAGGKDDCIKHIRILPILGGSHEWSSKRNKIVLSMSIKLIIEHVNAHGKAKFEEYHQESSFTIHALQLFSAVPWIYMAQVTMGSTLLFASSSNIFNYISKFTKIIVSHYMTIFPDISRRARDKYHNLQDDDIMKNIFNSGRHKNKVGMQIPAWMITDEMKHTEHYRMYAEVFGIDVPLTQSQPTESTKDYAIRDS